MYTTKQAKAFPRQTLWGRTEEQFFLIKKSHYNALPHLSPVSFADSKNNRLHCMFIYSFVFNKSYIRIITSKYIFIDTHTGCISRNNRYNEKKTNTTTNNNSTTLGESTGEEQSPLTDQTGRKCVHNRCIAFILTYICILYVAYCSA